MSTDSKEKTETTLHELTEHEKVEQIVTKTQLLDIGGTEAKPAKLTASVPSAQGIPETPKVPKGSKLPEVPPKGMPLSDLCLLFIF